VSAARSAELHGQATWAAGTRPAPAITTLRDQGGGLFSLASLRGRTVAMAFFDSRCTAACPLEGRALAAAERALRASQRPVLVAVSVNPRDTPASARKAARAWGLAAVAPWYWLMGAREQLAPVWKAYGIYVSPHLVNGDIVHTEALYLIDRAGYERSAYLYPFAPRFVTLDLRTLARGSRS
jgi:protein SCO1/2